MGFNWQNTGDIWDHGQGQPAEYEEVEICSTCQGEFPLMTMYIKNENLICMNCNKKLKERNNK